MTKERRLGRGLEALLGQIPNRSGPALPAQYPPAAAGPHAAESEPADGRAAGALSPLALNAPTIQSAAAPSAGGGLLRLDIDRIESNPAQPREQYDPAEMQSLADSLAAHGLLQPVVVRRVGDGYQLIAGERRLRAAVQAGWTDVPVNIVEADDREVAELAIIENLHRKDLNALEKARSFQRYLEQYGCTQEELAGRLNLDRSTIANLIRLLELPEGVQDALRKGVITPGHAKALLPLGDEEEQMVFCQRIQREGLNVRQTETMVQEAIQAADAEPLSVIGRDGQQRRPRRVSSEHVAALEQEFRTALGLKVKITHNAHGRGKLVVNFRSHEEFDQLREHICGTARPDTQSRAG